jgi:hypothetical protein
VVVPCVAPLQVLILLVASWLGRRQGQAGEFFAGREPRAPGAPRSPASSVHGRGATAPLRSRKAAGAKSARRGGVARDTGDYPPVVPRERLTMPWKTFLKARWRAIAAADFFSVEVLTRGGLVRYLVLFVIDLKTRRVHAQPPGIGQLDPVPVPRHFPGRPHRPSREARGSPQLLRTKSRVEPRGSSVGQYRARQTGPPGRCSIESRSAILDRGSWPPPTTSKR